MILIEENYAQDVGLDEGALYVRRQWTRLNEYAPPKTKAAIRRIPISSSSPSEDD